MGLKRKGVSRQEGQAQGDVSNSPRLGGGAVSKGEQSLSLGLMGNLTQDILGRSRLAPFRANRGLAVF